MKTAWLVHTCRKYSERWNMFGILMAEISLNYSADEPIWILHDMGFGYCSSAVLRLMAFDSNTLNVNEEYSGMYERRKGRDGEKDF